MIPFISRSEPSSCSIILSRLHFAGKGVTSSNSLPISMQIIFQLSRQTYASRKEIAISSLMSAWCQLMMFFSCLSKSNPADRSRKRIQSVESELEPLSFWRRSEVAEIESVCPSLSPCLDTPMKSGCYFWEIVGSWKTVIESWMVEASISPDVWFLR